MMTNPALTDPAILVTAIASALRIGDYCDPGYSEEIARNAVQALIAGDGASPEAVIADALTQPGRLRHVRHTAKAAQVAARAWAVAERPESQRERYLLAVGVTDPRGYLRAHGLLGEEARVCA